MLNNEGKGGKRMMQTTIMYLFLDLVLYENIGVCM